ncbi:hypothetical protein KVP10_09915 [Candidimonas humi]|uniref:Uncharacterized protein n=1 Tax=Candidimonas humi TaxID=683355 RepID=A0ABV8NY43_9BURK|nr:hypothetical protein [Candidimonas humi]MBV6305202.1 hypothetical protein [Candidimonas humi]
MPVHNPEIYLTYQLDFPWACRQFGMVASRLAVGAILAGNPLKDFVSGFVDNSKLNRHDTINLNYFPGMQNAAFAALM